jgi:hypothetical protein
MPPSCWKVLLLVLVGLVSTVHGFVPSRIGLSCYGLEPTRLAAEPDPKDTENTDDDDDGWGETQVDQQQVLQELRESPKAVTTPSSSTTPERDLFIPIFALVSLAGLFGAYGYEMLRLASRGELYLPWN